MLTMSMVGVEVVPAVDLLLQVSQWNSAHQTGAAAIASVVVVGAAGRLDFVPGPEHQMGRSFCPVRDEGGHN